MCINKDCKEFITRPSADYINRTALFIPVRAEAIKKFEGEIFADKEKKPEVSIHIFVTSKPNDTCPGLPRTFLKIPRCPGKTRDVFSDMTTKVSGPKVPRSPGNSRDIPGCPCKHDYQSPRSKSLKKTWDIPGYPCRHNYQSPRSKISRSPGTTQDIPGYPTRELLKSMVQKSQEVLGQLRTSLQT